MSEELKVPSSLDVHLDDLFGDKALVGREDARKWARELCGELNSAITALAAERDRLREALKELSNKANGLVFECQNYMGTKEERLGHYCGNCQSCDLSDLFDDYEALAGGEA